MRIIRVAPISTSGHSDAVALIKSMLGPEVSYVNAPDGSPRLVGYDAPAHISVSHSRHWVAVAVDSCFPIGIDVEEYRIAQLSRVADRFLSLAEKAVWTDNLTEAWTCKEAVYKAALTPGLALKDIRLLNPEEADVPDGRKFRLTTTSTLDYCLTIAQPII